MAVSDIYVEWKETVKKMIFLQYIQTYCTKEIKLNALDHRRVVIKFSI